VEIRAYEAATDLAWAEAILDAEFGGRLQARRGGLMDPLAAGAAGCVAVVGGKPVGLVTWLAGGELSSAGEAEVRVLVVAEEMRRQGAGTALLDAAAGALAATGVARAWLVTTNDNLEALGFYQRRGWRLTALHPGAVDDARRALKPSIAAVGASGIPVRDELVLALDLQPSPDPASRPTSISTDLG